MNAAPTAHFVAQTAEQARLLLNPPYAPVLGALLHGEASAGEVATAAEITLKQAHHRLTRLLGAGLIEITGERKRGGRPVKVYRALAEVYRVPFELTEAATVTELTTGMIQPYVTASLEAIGQLFKNEIDRDVLVALDARKQISISLDGSRNKYKSGLRGMYGTCVQIRLSQEAREEAERRMRELREWIAEQDAQRPELADAQDCIAVLLFTLGGLEK
ncbi:helix-turn-helix domain-containing protein [Deinococcus frigens]|uniref:helix-turn-helix domain-containing protein n=1 Tax=Deinococcus frigens TaxID=249403 RepID=UPI00068CD3C0|nr:helix-turn-helix domain-containing protein [Deinococcus frigens]